MDENQHMPLKFEVFLVKNMIGLANQVAASCCRYQQLVKCAILRVQGGKSSKIICVHSVPFAFLTLNVFLFWIDTSVQQTWKDNLIRLHECPDQLTQSWLAHFFRVIYRSALTSTAILIYGHLNGPLWAQRQKERETTVAYAALHSNESTCSRRPGCCNLRSGTGLSLGI